jgi:hypothetical protein
MAFSAGEVTTRLVNGKVIFWTGEMDSRDQSEKAIVCPFKGGFTGKSLSLFDLDKTASLRISLLN